MRAAAAALLVLVALGPGARADSTADEADFRFHRAAQLYKRGDVEGALSEFLASNRLVKNHNVAFNIARCFEQLGLHNEAHRWYVELLGEQALPEDDRALVKGALERLLPHLALLQIDSDPPGAAVYVGRRDLGVRGQAPLTLALREGKAEVLAELEGFRPARAEARLTVGQTVRVALPLERIWGRLLLEGQPAGTEVRLDQADAATLALAADGSAQVLPGSHLLFVSAPGFLPERLAVQVPPDGEARLQLRLTPKPRPTGRLLVRDNVGGALVRIDGNEMGFTPGVLESVAVGEREVEVSAEGREPFRSRVRVVAGETALVEGHLRYQQAQVVAAQKLLTTAQEAPASITVIEADELRGFGYQTLAEALRSVRGLYLNDDRDYQALGVRGLSTPGTYNERVLVLFDGHITNEVSGQGYIGRDFSPDLSDVERIEVIRGPGSVLYGSAAFLAVVNVVHRAPPEGSHAELAGALGTPGENSGAVRASLSGPRGYAVLSASGTAQAGEPVFTSPLLSGPLSGFAAGLDGEQALHADLRAGLGDWTLLASYNQRKKTIPTAPFDTVFGLDGTYTIDRRAFVELGYSHLLQSGARFDARASYDTLRYRGSWQYIDPVAPGAVLGDDSSDDDWLEGEARLRLPAFGSHLLLLGAEVQYRPRVDATAHSPDASGALVQSFSRSESEWVASLYGGDDVKVNEQLSLSLAVRLDHHDSFGWVANPRLSLLGHLYPDGHTKLLFGQAFRAPNLYERYFNDGGQSQIAADHLEPERISTLELEHTHQFDDALSLLGDAWYSRIEDLVYSAPVTESVVQYRNGGVVHSAGLEAEVRWRPGRGALFSLWYAWNRTVDSAGQPVANSPAHSGAARLLYPLAGELLSLATELTYGGPRHTVVDTRNPDQLVGEQLFWNLGLTGSHPRWRVRYGAHVFNLLDQRPLLPGGPEIGFSGHAVPQPGRTLRLSGAVAF